jgi:hypothetical protein
MRKDVKRILIFSQLSLVIAALFGAFVVFQELEKKIANSLLATTRI